MQNVGVITTTLSSKFQTVVPAKLRRILDIKENDELIWELDKDAYSPTIKLMVKRKKWGSFLAGLGKEIWQSIDTDKYIKDLRNEWER